MNFDAWKAALRQLAWDRAYLDPGYRERKKERDERIKAIQDEDKKDFNEVMNAYLK